VSRKGYTRPRIDLSLYLTSKSLPIVETDSGEGRIQPISKESLGPDHGLQMRDRGIEEHCGLIGIYSLTGEPVSERIVKGLSALQHRGQESWGIAVPGEPIVKGLGLIGVGAASNARKILRLEGNQGIGHVRYSTRGRTTLDNASPMDIKGEFSIAQNGTVANTEDVAPLVTGEFPIVDESNDTRLAGYRLLQHYHREHDWTRAFNKLSRELSGSYCFMILTKEGDVLAARDESGFRPLCLGYDEETQTHIIASESCALTALHADFVRDVQPGELVRLSKEGITASRFADSPRHYHCPFEYTYFAHPSSTIEGHNVYQARRQLGKVLARKYPFKGDVVIPVPDSARPAALGYSEESGIPMEEGLMKDRYRKKGNLRSFIEPTDESREEIVREIITIKPVVEGKRVIVVDDSIVRGTSSKNIVQALRDAGAKKVYMVVTFPPIRHPCYMGIDFPTREELLASRIDGDTLLISELNKKVGNEIGVDGLGYNDIEGLVKGIGLGEDEMCFACVTGNYLGLKKDPVIRSRKEMKA
jgi:amidophosphoribosyltransferase